MIRQTSLVGLTAALLALLSSPASMVHAQQAAPDNIVIVLDASRSMLQQMPGTGLTRMDAAKQALIKVMQKASDTTQVGLLVFSSQDPKTRDWVYPLGPLDRRRLEEAIRKPLPDGGTPLGAYLKKGADALLEQREKQRGYGTFRLLVVTDGEATDKQLVDRYLPDLMTRGITVDVIGVDMKADLALATQVHSYRRANNPEELTRAVSSVFAEIGQSKQGQDVAQAEAFAALEAIPDAVAQSMLVALHASGNHPIGEMPPSATGTAGSGPGPGGPVSHPGSPPMPGENTGKGWAWVAVLILIGGGLAVGWGAFKSQHRGGRS